MVELIREINPFRRHGSASIKMRFQAHPKPRALFFNLPTSATMVNRLNDILTSVNIIFIWFQNTRIISQNFTESNNGRTLIPNADATGNPYTCAYSSISLNIACNNSSSFFAKTRRSSLLPERMWDHGGRSECIRISKTNKTTHLSNSSSRLWFIHHTPVV